MANTNTFPPAFGKFGVPDWAYDYPEPGSQRPFGSDDDEFIVTFPTLSRGPKYHLDSLLAYAEVIHDRRSANTLSKPKDLYLLPVNFTKYSDLIDELKLLIIQHAVSGEQPRRVILNANESTLPPPRCPVTLEVDSMWRSEYVKHNVSVPYRNTSGGRRNLLLELDIPFLSNSFGQQVSASELLRFFRQSGTISSIKCMAVSTRLHNFSDIIRSFAEYTGLELVFVVLKENGNPSLMERKWGLKQGDEDPRLSYPQEPMFELLHPNNAFLNAYDIPGFEPLPGRRYIFHKEKRALEVLHKAMARKQPDGTLISPHLRFVRLIHCIGMV